MSDYCGWCPLYTPILYQWQLQGSFALRCFFGSIFSWNTSVFVHRYMRNKTQWGIKCLAVFVKRQRPSRSFQYKRKIWSLVKRIKLPHPSKATREHHKFVNNPRRHWTPLSILDWQRGMCVGLWDEPSITASSHTWSRAQKLPNMQVSEQNMVAFQANRKII